MVIFETTHFSSILMLYRYEAIVHFYSIQDFTLMPSFVCYLFNAGFIFLNVMWNIFLHRPNKIEVAFCMAWRTREVIWINCNKWEKKNHYFKKQKCIFQIEHQNFFSGNFKKNFVVKILSFSFPYSVKMLEKRRICCGIHEFTV